MDLDSLEHFNGFMVEMGDIVVCLCRLFDVEKQTVVSDLAVEGFFYGDPVQIRQWL
jgi:hypothetical protein